MFMETIKICTFNLRYDVFSDGKNMFACRTPYIKEAIRRESPDIIGFQEVKPHMLVWLRETFPEYIAVGCGRGADYKDESNPVLFKKDRFDFINYDVFWLSKTPYIPGLKYDEKSGCPRICTVVTLKKTESAKPFRVYNTHLDHLSADAKIGGLEIILKRVKKDDERMEVTDFLIGDFNSFPDSEPIRYLKEYKTRPFSELTSDLTNTAHVWGTRTDLKIDYIFASGNIILKEVKTWNDCFDGVYLSDHYPVSVTVEIE